MSSLLALIHIFFLLFTFCLASTLQSAFTHNASSLLRVGQLLTTTRDQYSVIRYVGHGDDGAVFETRVLATGESVAVKLFWYPHRYRAELNATERLDQRLSRQARIVRLLDRAPEMSALFLPWSDQGTLDAWVEKRGGITEEEVCALFTPLLQTLDDIHREGLVVMDIKANNILLFTNSPEATEQLPIAKFADFGQSFESIEPLFQQMDLHDFGQAMMDVMYGQDGGGGRYRVNPGNHEVSSGQLPPALDQVFDCFLRSEPGECSTTRALALPWFQTTTQMHNDS